MTPEEYLALPEEKPYLEYSDGMVVQKPMPTGEHADISAYITIELGLYCRQHGGRVRPEARAALGDLPSYRLPDLGFFAGNQTPDDDSVPTLAIEIRSRSQTLAELEAKCRQYLAAGTSECWVVDPVSTSVLVMNNEANKRIPGTADLVSDVVPGFVLSLPALFAAAK